MNSTKIRLSLPQIVMAVYLVPVNDPPEDLAKVVREGIMLRVQEPARAITQGLLGTAALQIDVSDKSYYPPLPMTVLKAMGASEEQLNVIEKASKFVLVRAINKAVWPPYHEFSGRTAAATLAAEFKSIVVDLFAPTVMSSADALRKLPTEQVPIAFTHWFTVINSSWETGIWITTKGMARIGLPEIQAIGVPPQLANQWSMAITALAWCIVKEFSKQIDMKSKADHFDLPSDIEVSANDVAEAYNKAQPEQGKTTIHLRFDARKDDDGNDYLTISVPETSEKTFTDYANDRMQELFGTN